MAPDATITFVFTDIEGSTHLWESAPEAMRVALARHDALLREAMTGAGGDVFKTVGDAFHVAFSDPTAALRAVVGAMRGLTRERWPDTTSIRVRMAVHTGTAERRGGDWFGRPLNRVARLLAIAHGGQTLLSTATSELVHDQLPDGATLRDMGWHRLRDLEQPERVFQLEIAGIAADFPALRTGTTVATNLPVQLTSFVGRESELVELRQLLTTSRLLTLTGPGGAGKTRLAVELAAGLSGSGTNLDRVSFVTFAALADDALVPLAITTAVGARERSGEPVLLTVVQHLRDRRTLLILDNCEHLLDACARVADVLLREVPGLTIVATSREPLGIAGETIHRVAALVGPITDAPDDLAASEATRLFIERARSVDPSFRVTLENASAIREICRRLDGLPLAIELAAARVVVLSPQEIALRLDDRFHLLTGGGRTKLPRQQTLRALVDWSHDLLGDDERVVFRRTAVFAGGFTFDAAEAVVGPAAGSARPLDPLDPLAGLVAKSLLTVERAARTRYSMLETIRAYALERLEAAGEAASTRAHHAAWCLGLVRTAEPQLVSAQQREWFDRLTDDHDNIAAALAWSLEHGGREALEIAKCLYWFWQARGHVTEGRMWFADALQRSDGTADPSLRASALLGAGSLSWAAGDNPQAMRELSESAQVAGTLGDGRGRALALAILSHAQVGAGDLVGARVALDEAVPLARASGDEFVTARTLGAWADLARHEGRDDQVISASAEAVSLFRRLGMDEGVAFNLLYGASAWRRSDPDRAQRDLHEAVERFTALDVPSGLYSALLGLLDVSSPSMELTAMLLGAVDALHQRAGPRDDVLDLRISTRLRNEAVDALGELRFDELAAQGAAQSPAGIAELVSGLGR